MVEVPFRDVLSVLRDNRRYNGNFVKRSPASHRAIGETIFQEADDFIGHLATSG